jgi:hypothetical protein
VGFLSRLFFGGGTFKPDMRASLEAEGLVVLEENLKTLLRYDHFRAPGRRFNGKVVALRAALAVTEQRIALYARSGRTKLIDTAYDNPRLGALTISTDDEGRLVFHIDYARFDDTPDVSGEITLRIDTPDAAAVARHVEARLARAA